MKTRRLAAVGLCASLAAVFSALGWAQQSSAVQVEGTSDRWFVELSSPPEAEGTSRQVLEQERNAFRAEAARIGLQYQERFSFSSLWNGVSIHIDPQHLGALSTLRGVRAVYPVQLAQVDPQRTPIGAELYTALAQTGADAVHDRGYTGAGIRVAVVDSGIDYEHPDLGGCFGTGCRVEQGFDFVGDAYQPNPAAPGFNPMAFPDPDPDDCNGHGSHVAGIIGARSASEEGITGVAPDVIFHAYRVFGCGVPVGSSVSTDTDILLAAIEAVGSAVPRPHVLNMSIGAPFQWPQYPTAQAADRLVDLGIAVVASAGNNGDAGAYASSAPGLGEKVISVASFENSHLRLPVFRISPDDRPIGYSPASGAPLPPHSGTLPMRRTGSQTSTTDACSSTTPSTPPAPGSLTGAAALIRRGGCSFFEKAINAHAAGAAAVVLYNNAPGPLSPSVIPPTDPPGLPAVTIPVVGISDSDGAVIDSRLAAGGPDSVSLTWTRERASSPNVPNGGLVSAFSSYGPAPDLAIKPDIGAPGGAIRSTYPLDHPESENGYATLSGTSMASPHTVGAVALLLQAKRLTPVLHIRDVLQNSADPHPWSLNPATGLLDHVHRQGAGMLDILGAIRTTTLVTPGKLSLGEVESGSVTRTLTITNAGSSDESYTLSHVSAVATRGTYPGTPLPPNPLQFLNAPSNVSFSTATVAVAPGSTATIDVTITPSPGAPDHTVFNGYLVATSGHGDVYRVPYAGFKGDYQSIPILTPLTAGFPWLTKLSASGFFVNQPGGATYSLIGDDVPYVIAHFDHQSYRLRLAVQHVATGQLIGRALYVEYMPRNPGPNSVFALPWNGSVETAVGFFAVPDGQYRLILSVLKPLGQYSDPAHYETWTSPIVTIARGAT